MLPSGNDGCKVRTWALLRVDGFSRTNLTSVERLMIPTQKLFLLLGIVLVFSNCSSESAQNQVQSMRHGSHRDTVQFIPWSSDTSKLSTTPVFTLQPSQPLTQSATQPPTQSALAEESPSIRSNLSDFWDGKPFYSDLSLRKMMRDHKRSNLFGPEVALEDQPIEYRAARAELIRRGALEEDKTESDSSKQPGITIILDTSYSMELQGALPVMKQAARRFVSKIREENKDATFQYYQFANEVERLDSLSDLDDKKSSGRFSALYSALAIAMARHPNNTILLFTDGADNKSPDNRQLPIQTLDEIVQQIDKKKTVIHTVKLGIEESNDSKGVDNREALAALSKYGRLYTAKDSLELAKQFEESARVIVQGAEPAKESAECADAASSLNAVVQDLEEIQETVNQAQGT